MESLIDVNSVPTKVIQFGLKRAIDGNNNPMIREKTIVLMISGNPGEIGYYYDFMADIHKQTDLPVLGISHAGHNVLPRGQSYPSIRENPDLYSLNGQIVHKMSFISKFISIDTKIILIGHSIGCYIILELLYRYPTIRSQNLHSILIFPAIESMDELFESKKYKFLFEWFKYPLLMLSHVLNQMSDGYKQWLMSFVLRRPQLTARSVRAATNLFDPNCVNALIHMSLFEFKTVKQLNREAIDMNANRLTFFYGEADQWCPIEIYRRIDQLYPNCDIQLCLAHMSHAFVLDNESTAKVSQMVVHKIDSVVKN